MVIASGLDPAKLEAHTEIDLYGNIYFNPEDGLIKELEAQGCPVDVNPEVCELGEGWEQDDWNEEDAMIESEYYLYSGFLRNTTEPKLLDGLTKWAEEVIGA